jgi:hypothetical protein
MSQFGSVSRANGLEVEVSEERRLRRQAEEKAVQLLEENRQLREEIAALKAGAPTQPRAAPAHSEDAGARAAAP